MVSGAIDKNIAFIGILIFLVFSILGKLVGVEQFINDSIVFIVFILFFYFSYDVFNLSPAVYSFLILRFIPHNLGIYGFYFQSPLFIPWVHVTHFFPLMAFSMVFFRFLKPYMFRFDFRAVLLIIVVLLASLGIGAIIEQTEFVGFLVNGFGDGGFAFGAGDGFPGQIVTSVADIEAFGGGWFNTMWDLVWNFLGALLGVIIMTVNEFIFTTKKGKSYKDISM